MTDCPAKPAGPKIACIPFPVLTGIIARTDRSAVHDGPGVRTIVFFKGCPLRCVWCHSPETQSQRPQVVLHYERCLDCGACVAACAGGAVTVGRAFGPGSTGIGTTTHGVDRERCKVCGECTAVCPPGARAVVGRTVTVAEVVNDIERDSVFHDQSGGGVTLSGGEPLDQPIFVEALLKRCRERRIHTAVETCGFAPPRTLLAIARWTDLFLYDLKLMDHERHRQATGQSNRRILENLRLLCARHGNVRVRVPLIGGVNDDRANIRSLAGFLSELPISDVDVLPYHAAGVAKYARLDRSYSLPESAVPTPASIERAVEMLSRSGLQVQIGGGR